MGFFTDDSFKHYLDNIWQNSKPLAKLFRSATAGYLYDTGTNKILACRDEVFELLRLLFERNVDDAIVAFTGKYGNEEFSKAAEEIVSAIKTEHILLTLKASQFGLSDHFKDIREILSKTVRSINLDITQECNLRCLYCIYNKDFESKRNHGSQVMSLTTAKRAIDFLKANSSESETLSIGFYGGEPLQRFDFVKDCVDYAKNVIKRKKIVFTVTTNATLMTPEIAEILLENDFSVLVSIDGPQDIHDRYRKDRAGNGSFKSTLKGLEILSRQYHRVKKGSISVNAVYAPPFSSKKLERINRFFQELEWLPDINILTYYPTEGSIPGNMATQEDLREDMDTIQWASKGYKKHMQSSGSMVTNLLEPPLAKIIQRHVFKRPVDRYYLNGCCLPGQRKAFILSNGDIHLCEKINTFAPVVGNVESGFDFETIQKFYIDEYADKSKTECSNCWALRLCDVCYISTLNKDGALDMNRKRQRCNIMRRTLAASLTDFVIFGEESPGGLDYLYDYDLI